MEARVGTAPGKIILCGEYAVVFGYEGIAVPAPLQMQVAYTPNVDATDFSIEWDAPDMWLQYARDIAKLCQQRGDVAAGTLNISCSIPLGKGMGSSTALVIAIARALRGEDCEAEAKAIEDTVNPGHSGLDFAVIWHGQPVQFKKGSQPELVSLPETLLKGALLIDTGTPNEATPELVADVKARETELAEALESIGSCAKRVLSGESLATVIRQHNLAQQELGMVTPEAKELIKKIEQQGGAAKVIGAGAKTGGCGIVLAINTTPELVDQFPTIQL